MAGYTTGSTADHDDQNNAASQAVPTTGHTWIIIVGALLLLWLLGGLMFRSVRV